MNGSSRELENSGGNQGRGWMKCAILINFINGSSRELENNGRM